MPVLKYSRHTGSGEIRCSTLLIMNGAQHSQKESGFISLDIGTDDTIIKW